MLTVEQYVPVGPVAYRFWHSPRECAMSEVEIPVMRVMAIRRDSPAWQLIIDAIPIHPGQLIPCTDEQFESLRRDCLILDILPPAGTYSPTDSCDSPQEPLE